MRYLLDTHTLAWAARNASLLSQRAATLLTDPGNELLISPANIWEMSIKYHAGKWPEAAPFLDAERYGQYRQRLGAQELSIQVAHARLAGQFSVDHRDPFDRILCAQAVNEGIPLISKDRHLDQFPIHREW